MPSGLSKDIVDMIVGVRLRFDTHGIVPRRISRFMRAIPVVNASSDINRRQEKTFFSYFSVSVSSNAASMK